VKKNYPLCDGVAVKIKHSPNLSRTVAQHICAHRRPFNFIRVNFFDWRVSIAAVVTTNPLTSCGCFSLFDLVENASALVATDLI